jgi:hypothetical protein
MTTKEQAESIINDLRKEGFTDDEISQAVVDMLLAMKGKK